MPNALPTQRRYQMKGLDLHKKNINWCQSHPVHSALKGLFFLLSVSYSTLKGRQVEGIAFTNKCQVDRKIQWSFLFKINIKDVIYVPRHFIVSNHQRQIHLLVACLYFDSRSYLKSYFLHCTNTSRWYCSSFLNRGKFKRLMDHYCPCIYIIYILVF